MSREQIYGEIYAEKITEGDNTKVNIYVGTSNFPFLILQNMEEIRRMRSFLDHIVHEDALEACRRTKAGSGR
ncbi:hypothetical protein FJZ19_00965 [Candidatus Pacearchaeota archaeon]|nr:hypothetical protein [Candidatus Pacearchaeota archaeon]